VVLISGHRTSSPIGEGDRSEREVAVPPPSAAGIILFTERDDEESASARLEEFAAEAIPAIESGLERMSR
jgi:hypothetical protein